MRTKRFILSILVLILGAVANAAPAPSRHKLEGFSDILSYELPNGMNVVLWPDEAAKQVAVDLWYRVGALHEKKGATGIAHLFEHMMFRPSKYAPQGGLAFERTMGAEVGAETRYKTTNFHISFAPEKLEEIVRYQADIMKNLPLDAAMLANEKEAVRSEYLNWDNAPFMVILPSLSERTFPGHIAQYFITGARADLAKIQPQDCLDFYRSYYAPNNAVLVIAGQFEPHKAMELIERYYGPIPKGVTATPPIDLKTLPMATILEKKVPGSSYPVAVTYPIPFQALPGNADSALDLAFSILFKGDSSIAGEDLINRKKLADGIGYDAKGLGFYFVTASLVADNGKDAIKAIDSAVNRLQSLGQTEYQRYATAYEAETLRGLQSPPQRAKALGYYLMYRNGIQALQTDLRAAKMISLEDARAAGARYISVQHRIAIIGKPLSK